MKTKKTPMNSRNTYKLFDENGEFVTEYVVGKDGVTEADILLLHKMDDHEVYVNSKENRHPEWFQPIYDEWKKKFISEFQKQNGRKPRQDEIPGRFRQVVSIDAQVDMDGDELGDSSKLEEEMAVWDEEPESDAVICLREIVASMPQQWQLVYRAVFIQGMSKAAAGRKIGISDVRVGQLAKKIKAELERNADLRKYFH